MKVQHIIVGLGVGGAELMLRRLIEAHSKDDSNSITHQVIVLTDIGVVGQGLAEAGVQIHALRMRSLLDAPRVFAKLVKLIRAARPDIVQTWMYHSDLLGGCAARIAGNSNVIWGVRTTDLDGVSSGTWIVRVMCAFLSRFIPRAIVCAAWASLSAHVKVGYYASKMLVIPNGFDVARFSHSESVREQYRESFGLERDACVIGTIGRFNAAKDQRNFVNAVATLAVAYPGARFLMIGSGLDRANEQLAQWIYESGCMDRFILLGERTDIAECLAAIDVFCLSSRTEGFPNVVGEAMAMGLPCVVTDVGDAAALLGDAGVVVPKADPAALADGIREILELPAAQRSALGARGKARIHSEFTLEKTVEQFNGLYQALINKEKAKR